ncbi:MAG TPA: tetratricopeptide repeat protein [Rhizomicrobium sp.]|jgi:tetratricopeptide (TPR) repeat protein|nr:tetratricopeptide repeat protein [Rhizomicrobium sp.]
MAQLRRDWRSALKQWRACAEQTPDDPAAAIGYIGALISAGGIEEAVERTAAFVRKHPKDENGPIASARIAELRGDFGAAIEHWQATLALKPEKLQALIRLGAALLKENRPDEALACADRLEGKFSAESHGAVLRAQIVQQERGFADAAPLWEAALVRFGNDAAFLRAYGRGLLSASAYAECLNAAARLRKSDRHASLTLEGAVLAKRAPYQDHTQFWKNASAELPDSVDLTRKLLDAALSSREFDVANAAFLRLVQQDRLTVRDADMVVGLVNLDLQSGNRPAARQKVRGYLKSMRGLPGYRAAAVRLHRTILLSFPNRADSARRISANIPVFVNTVCRARLSVEATQPLETIAALEGGLSGAGAGSLLDSDIDADVCRTLIDEVRERLRTATPFSFIRLGDGEANALHYPLRLAEHFDSDAAEREKVWWGRTLDSDTRAQLATRVRCAIENADAIGVPTRSRLLRDVRLDGGPALARRKSGRGLISVMGALEEATANGSLAGKIVTSAHVHQDMERWNIYGELFDGVSAVVLVSCHAALPDELMRRFGLRTAKHVLMPPGDAMLEMQHRALTDNEVPPASLNRALADLGDWPRGRMVLIGAGYAGKVIVDEARRRGGVALDLGSIFDGWLGHHTRSYQDLA